MTRKNLRLLSYIRVSDVRGREGPSFISPDEQRAKNAGYAAAYDHSIVEEGIELDRSGGDKTRPVFADFMAKIQSGEADGIIVAKLDRFARSNALAYAAIEAIEDAGGVLISVSEQIDTSGYAGKFMRSIFLATAEMERNRIGEQWLSARGRAVDRGIHVSRHTPPGYKRLEKSTDEATDRRLVPDPKHAETVREAFSMAANGETYSRIANYLTERKLPVAGNGETTWGSNRIKRFLANCVYLGEARSGVGMTNAEAHEPLVSQAVWTLAQREQAPAITENLHTLLAGLCRCASCTFSMRSQKARGTTVAAYRCGDSQGRCPKPTTISLLRLEEYVLARFLDRASMTLESVEEIEDDGAADVAVEAERSYRAVLLDTQLRRDIGDADHSALAAKLKAEWQEALAAVPHVTETHVGLGSTDLHALVSELQSRGDVLGLRELLASAIQAVFVRPAASRAHNLPIEDRVRIVWKDEAKLELPKRGERFEPRAFTW
jgi:DNA invertase Pin-like site-specific DNA recombinase